MNLTDHYASCPGWETGHLADCTCYEPPAWRIRKEPGGQFPWRIWRRTSDFTYAPLMCASTFDGAMELVSQFVWLRKNALNRETNV